MVGCMMWNFLTAVPLPMRQLVQDLSKIRRCRCSGVYQRLEDPRQGSGSDSSAIVTGAMMASGKDTDVVDEPFARAITPYKCVSQIIDKCKSRPTLNRF